jgi:hypothetical protein
MINNRESEKLPNDPSTEFVVQQYETVLQRLNLEF